MISFDKTHNQLLSAACLNCHDPYFAPANDSIPKVGCCSYSPVFSLFELNACIRRHDAQFFLDKIYHHPSATISDFAVTVHAQIHKSFFDLDLSSFSSIELTDTKLSYSVCQFFKDGVGCILHPTYKNAVCRSFICTTIEQQLSDIEQKLLTDTVKLIQEEAHSFNKHYIKLFQQKNWNFHNHIEQITAHFLDKKK